MLTYTDTHTHTAPMVRISTLPLRLLALAQGADLVWTEEMVAKKVAPCKRIVNPRLRTVEFYDHSSPWSRVWQTCSEETASVVFQIGVLLYVCMRVCIDVFVESTHLQYQRTQVPAPRRMQSLRLRLLNTTWLQYASTWGARKSFP